MEASWAQAGEGGDRGEELEAARRARELAPGEPSVEFRLAVLLHGSGDFEGAAKAFGAAAQSSAELGEAAYLDAGRLGRCACLLELGDPAGALEGLAGVGPAAQLWLGSLHDARSVAEAAKAALGLG